MGNLLFPRLLQFIIHDLVEQLFISLQISVRVPERALRPAEQPSRLSDWTGGKIGIAALVSSAKQRSNGRVHVQRGNGNATGKN
jgi:hypothetical protein